MRAGTHRCLLLVAAAPCLLVPRWSEAVTQVHGSTFAEDTMASRPRDDSNLFQTGVVFDVVPATKKDLKANLNVRFNYVRTDEDELAHLSPFGNMALDLVGESYTANAQHSRHATLGTATQLTETKVSRASVSVAARDLPRLSASVSRTESQTGSSPANESDSGSVSATYQYGWLQLRAGLSADRRSAGAQPSNESGSVFGGAGGSYEILPATLLSADVDVSRFDARSATSARSSSRTSALRVGADSRPLAWLGLVANLSRSATDFEAGSTSIPGTMQQVVDGTANLHPHRWVRLGATLGNRRFSDVQKVRSVDYRTLSAAFSGEVRDRVLLGVTASRTLESDPAQGENVSDTLAVNAAADLTSRISLRLGTTVNRWEDRTFVSAQTYSASGTLADRDRLDRDSGGLPPGFTFFDTVGSDVYTKNSSALGDWSLTLHIDPVVGRTTVGRSVQILAVPTDRTNVSLAWTSSASADSLPLGRIGNQNLNGSLTYVATRRSSLGLSGTASFPEHGGRAYSTTGAYSYRFARGHQASVSYGRQVTAARRNDTLSGTLTFVLRKRSSLGVTYSATQLFQPQQTDFVLVRASHSF